MQGLGRSKYDEVTGKSPTPPLHVDPRKARRPEELLDVSET